MALKSRKEMDPQYMWDLSHIFPTREAWEKAYQEAEALCKPGSEVAGTLGDSADSLLAGLNVVIDALRAVELVYLYASLNKSGDQGDAEAQTLEARAVTLYVKLSTVTSFVDPEILAIPEDKLAAYMADPRLAVYRQYLRNTGPVPSAHAGRGARAHACHVGDAAQVSVKPALTCWKLLTLRSGHYG